MGLQSRRIPGGSLQWFPPGNADAIFGTEIEVGAAILGASEKISRQ
jgi:hypothetical protein